MAGMKRRRWSDADDAAVLRGYRRGDHLRDVANSIRRSYGATRMRLHRLIKAGRLSGGKGA